MIGRAGGGALAVDGGGGGAALATAGGGATSTGSGADGVTAHQRPTARNSAPPTAGSQSGDFGSSGAWAVATWAGLWLIFAQRFDSDGLRLSSGAAAP